jgi:hypothetical protein
MPSVGGTANPAPIPMAVVVPAFDAAIAGLVPVHGALELASAVYALQCVWWFSFHNICCGRSLRSAREMPFLLVEMLIGLEDTRIGRIQTTDSNQAMLEWKYPAQIFCPNSVSC